MNLKIGGELFLILGATSGFGRAVCEALMHEKASVIGVARNANTLEDMENTYPLFQGIALDIFKPGSVDELLQKISDKKIKGVLVNAGGPPATTAMDTELKQWDEAYNSVLRWKIELTKKIIPRLENVVQSRVIYIESASVKQPIENLVLSNSLRMAVVGFVKTLTQEMPDSATTFNIIAPGYHKTSAVERLVKKKAEKMNVSEQEAQESMESKLPRGKIGNPDDLASMAAWLFSPHSDYINGQIFYVDGGANKATL
ncbi:MAG: SDR family oxidoreductase [Bacteroidota bacterium]